MFAYDKQLQYPVKIRRTDPRMAALIISQYGGPDGELAASLRYLSQRFSMPCKELKALLTDIGTEELGHLEIVGAMVHQLTRNLTDDQAQAAGFAAYYADHGNGVYPQAAAGVPFTASFLAVKGDPITDLHEDLAAEQKARTTYENLLRLADDADVKDVLRYLRQREIVHYQRFAEGLALLQEKLNARNFYAFNPAQRNICGQQCCDNDNNTRSRTCCDNDNSTHSRACCDNDNNTRTRACCDNDNNTRTRTCCDNDNNTRTRACCDNDNNTRSRTCCDNDDNTRSRTCCDNDDNTRNRTCCNDDTITRSRPCCDNDNNTRTRTCCTRDTVTAPCCQETTTRQSSFRPCT